MPKLAKGKQKVCCIGQCCAQTRTYKAKRFCKLCCFILDTMDYFLAGKDQRQTISRTARLGWLWLVIFWSGPLHTVVNYNWCVCGQISSGGWAEHKKLKAFYSLSLLNGWRAAQWVRIYYSSLSCPRSAGPAM